MRLRLTVLALASALLVACAAPPAPPLAGPALARELERISDNHAEALGVLQVRRDIPTISLIRDLTNLALHQGHEIDRLRAELTRYDALLVSINQNPAAK